MSSFKITGFDKLEKQLRQMEKGAKELSQTKHISFEELFPASFRNILLFPLWTSCLTLAASKLNPKKILKQFPT